MVFRNFRKSSKKVKKSFRGKRSRPSRGVSSAVKSYVKRQISSNIENKTQYDEGQITISAYNVSTSLYAIPLSPYTNYTEIFQNVGAGSRIGNQIKIKKVVLKYILTPLPYNATLNPTPCPQMIKLWFGYQKNKPLERVAATPSFFQLGSTASQPTGFLQDLIQATNKDLFKIYKSRVHKLGFANNQGSGGQVGYQYEANNDFKMNIMSSIDVTRYMTKKILFSDTGIDQTNGHGLFMYATAIRADGQVNAPQPVTLQWWLDYSYEDA